LHPFLEITLTKQSSEIIKTEKVIIVEIYSWRSWDFCIQLTIWTASILTEN